MKQITREGMKEIASKLVKKMDHIKVFTFTGSLGAGKTTLVQNMLKEAGVEGPIQSPTYTYVSVYRLKNGTMLYHFDLYRLDSLNDFLEAGFEEYLYQPNSYCFIEWPEIIKPLLKDSVCHVILEYESENTRIVVIE